MARQADWEVTPPAQQPRRPPCAERSSRRCAPWQQRWRLQLRRAVVCARVSLVLVPASHPPRSAAIASVWRAWHARSRRRLTTASLSRLVPAPKCPQARDQTAAVDAWAEATPLGARHPIWDIWLSHVEARARTAREWRRRDCTHSGRVGAIGPARALAGGSPDHPHAFGGDALLGRKLVVDLQRHTRASSCHGGSTSPLSSGAGLVELAHHRRVVHRPDRTIQNLRPPRVPSGQAGCSGHSDTGNRRGTGTGAAVLQVGRAGLQLLDSSARTACRRSRPRLRLGNLIPIGRCATAAPTRSSAQAHRPPR